MAEYKITASMNLNLEPVIAEAKETAQALLDFADRLIEIDKKYSDEETSGKEIIYAKGKKL